MLFRGSLLCSHVRPSFISVFGYGPLIHFLHTDDFSIEQLFRLWDRLLPSSSQMPFYLGYAIMKQLREIILPLDFNACILLFSSLPSIDLEQFVEDAMETARNTPISITMPNYVHDEVCPFLEFIISCTHESVYSIQHRK